MMQNIDSLSVLFVGNRKPDHENIRQRLSDGFHCPVFFDFAAAAAAYSQSIAKKRYDIIIADDTPEDFRPEEILRSAVSSGIPVIFLLEAIDMSAFSALLDMGAAGFICRNDPDQLVSEVLKALLSAHRQRSRYSLNDNALAVQEILDNFTDAIYVLDHAWRVTYINHKVEKCWNCKRDDLIGKVLWDCFPSIAQLPDRDMHEIAMRDRIAVQWETSSPDKAIWAAISTYPTRDGGVSVSFRDITENKHAETVLRLSRERQTILLKLSDCLRCLNNPGDIHEAAARIMGEYLRVDAAFYCDVVIVDGAPHFLLDNVYSVSDSHVPLGLHPINSQAVLANENQEGRNIVVFDMETDPRIGDERRPALRDCRLCAWVSVPFMKNGRFVASFIVHQRTPRNWSLEEIALIEETAARTWAEVERVRVEAALKKSEQHALQLVAELENADQNKNDFIHSLSHELRNPLASIVTGLSMLDILDSNPDTENARRIIKRQTDQLCHLVDDLLDLTRITNNKIQMNTELFDLGELTRTSVYDVRLPIPANSVSTGIFTVEEAEIYVKPLKILLIDDNRDLAELTCSLLTLCGYDAVSSYSGLDGIQKAKEFMPHVIICDIGLPDINGYEVARRISDSGDLGNACFISLSGYAQASDFDESREAGFALHICKPVDFDKLKSILESIARKLIV